MPGEPIRHVRVADDLWTSAQETARARGETLSEVIRHNLARYVAGDDLAQPERPWRVARIGTADDPRGDVWVALDGSSGNVCDHEHRSERRAHECATRLNLKESR